MLIFLDKENFFVFLKIDSCACDEALMSCDSF